MPRPIPLADARALRERGIGSRPGRGRQPRSVELLRDLRDEVVALADRGATGRRRPSTSSGWLSSSWQPAGRRRPCSPRSSAGPSGIRRR